jgi:hypothetical protein
MDFLNIKTRMRCLDYIKNWRNEDIRVEKTRNGKLSVCDYRDNLIIPSHLDFEKSDVSKKLIKSSHIRDFPPESQKELTKILGFYTDLQSLRSEDAITYSVFGTLHYYSLASQIDFIESMLKLMDVNQKVSNLEISLWTRLPHPHTGIVSHGPEMDFIIKTDTLDILGESKWIHKISGNQGILDNLNQLQIREEVASTNLEKNTIVLYVGRENINLQGNFVSLTWDELCSKTSHPNKEVYDYYLWKNRYGT